MFELDREIMLIIDNERQIIFLYFYANEGKPQGIGFVATAINVLLLFLQLSSLLSLLDCSTAYKYMTRHHVRTAVLFWLLGVTLLRA